jgi:hypothetical protein
VPRVRLTPFRRAVAASSFAAGFAYANLAIALPLLALAEHRSPSFAAGLLGANTLAFAAGGGAAAFLRRPQSGLARGLVAIAAGDVLVLTGTVAPVVLMTAGALVNGIGMGLFWAGTMAALGGHAGGAGSPRRFVGQYVFFTIGGATGAFSTGAVLALLRALGLAGRVSIQLSLLLGAACAAVALPHVLGWVRTVADRRDPRGFANPLQRIAIQVPDLFLTGSAGIFVALSPVVLFESFDFTAAAIGVVSGGIAGAKIVGSLAAGRIGRVARVANLAPAMLLLAAASVAGLAVSRNAWLFVALLLLAVVFALGAWPVLVDGSLARVAPAERLRFSITWTMRENVAIAAATIGGGYLVRGGERPTLLLSVAALLLLGAAAGAAATLRRPLFEPAPVDPAFPHVVHHPNSLAPGQAGAHP